MVFSRVLLPHPEGPTIAPKCPPGRWRVIPESRGASAEGTVSSTDSSDSTTQENPRYPAKATRKKLQNITGLTHDGRNERIPAR